MVLGNLLGNSALRIAVIEKQSEVYPIPRATHLDEETLRNFQLTGLMPQLEKHTCLFGKMEVCNENGERLFEEEIIQHGAEHGYAGSRFFDQPAFERILRDGLNRFKNITLFSGYEGTGISQNENEVSVQIRNLSNNEELTLNGKYAVGCDGGRSMVRTSLNIEMTALESAREWVIVDSILKDENEIGRAHV